MSVAAAAGGLASAHHVCSCAALRHSAALGLLQSMQDTAAQLTYYIHCLGSVGHLLLMSAACCSMTWSQPVQCAAVLAQSIQQHLLSKKLFLQTTLLLA
jgi:hypothetical protein